MEIITKIKINKKRDERREVKEGVRQSFNFEFTKEQQRNFTSSNKLPLRSN